MASTTSLRPAGLVRSSDRVGLWLALAAASSAGMGVLVYADSRLAFTLLLAAVAILVLLLWPYAALLVVLATAFRDSQVLELATLVGGGVAIIVAGRRSLRSFVAVCLLILVAIALRDIPLSPTYVDGAKPPSLYLPALGIAYLGTPSDALLAWLRLAFLLVAFLVAAWTIRDERRLSLAVWAAVAGAGVPIVQGLIQLASGQLVVRSGSTTKAVEGPFPYPNYFAFYLLGVLIMGLVLLLRARSARARAALGVLLAGGAVCLFFTYTRSAWIGFSLALLVIGILQYRWIIPIGAVALVCASLLFPGTVRAVNNRFGDLSSKSANHAASSWTWRTGQWDRMIPYGLHHPLTGMGFGSYQAVTVREFGYEDLSYPTLSDAAHPETSPKGFTAHNDYVRMLVELGFPGVVLWSAVLLGLLVTAIRATRVPSVRPFAVGATALMVALIVASYSDNIQGYTADLVIPMAVVGALSTIRRNRGRSTRGVASS